MNKFVIVGGGTAGWLSALFVKKVTGKQVTVIASNDIPIIGAGEDQQVYYLMLFVIAFGILVVMNKTF